LKSLHILQAFFVSGTAGLLNVFSCIHKTTKGRERTAEVVAAGSDTTGIRPDANGFAVFRFAISSSKVLTSLLAENFIATSSTMTASNHPKFLLAVNLQNTIRVAVPEHHT
jgi:hypothetical protein